MFNQLKKFIMKKGIFILLICLPAMAFAQWSNNPALNTKIVDTIGMQVQPKVIVNPEGESYVSWFSESGDMQFDVYMQRMDVNGNKLWDEGGLLISDHPTMSWTTDYDLVLDKAGNAILITQDMRNGNSNVYAYSISPDGEFLWGNDGIALTNDDGFDPGPAAVVDQEGNIVTMWEAMPADTNLFISISLQKLSPEGELLWDNVVIENDTASCWMPYMINTEDTCTVVVWIETQKRDTSSAMGDWGFMHAYAQKIDADGNFVWTDKVVVDTLFNMPLFPFMSSLATDGNGGLYVSWMAFPNYEYYTCFAQYINSQGIVQWTPNGVNVSDSIQFQHTEPHVAAFPQGEGMFVFWNELRPRSDTDWENAVFGQKFSVAGERQWSTQGKLIDSWFNALITSVSIHDALTIEDDIVLFFEHEYIAVVSPDTLDETDYYAMRINTDGDPVWSNNKTIFANAPSWKLGLNVSNMGHNQWIAVWEDNRNDPEHEFQFGIYAQNISVDGVIGPLSVPTITNPDNLNIVLSPNPANNFVNIDYTLTTNGIIQIDLLDVNGRIIVQFNDGKKSLGTYSKQIDVRGLSTGMYIIRLQVNNSQVYGKIIKN